MKNITVSSAKVNAAQTQKFIPIPGISENDQQSSADQVNTESNQMEFDCDSGNHHQHLDDMLLNDDPADKLNLLDYQD